MSSQRDSSRIVIAGASSLLGTELKSLLEESRFAGWDLSLVDEETAAGTLTEAGGEPAVIQPVEEGTFAKARLIFFSGSESFTERNLASAQSSGAIIIDLSGAFLRSPSAKTYFAAEDSGSTKASKDLFCVPSAPGLVTAGLIAALGGAGLSRLALTFFRPVSEAGRDGIEELETQTSQLLSFQSVGQPVFDTQVAFSMLDGYGSQSREKLQSIRERIRTEARAAVAENGVQPSIQVLHAPVFYGYTFSALAELNSQTQDSVVNLVRKAGITVNNADASPTGNLTASGESAIQVAVPEPDPARPNSWWFWGAADNIRLPASTAVKLAERLLQ
jgi:aspartate-semialdehyde dehydrogenase